MPVIHVAQMCGVSAPAVHKWFSVGCPRNDDGTCDSVAVVNWLQERSSDKNSNSGRDMKDEKTEWEIERLKAQVAKMNDESMDRSEHEQIVTAMATSLRIYMEKTLMANLGFLAHKSIDELRVRMFEVLRQMTEALTGKKPEGTSKSEMRERARLARIEAAKKQPIEVAPT